MICRECAASLKENARFCPQCGAATPLGLASVEPDSETNPFALGAWRDRNAAASTSHEASELPNFPEAIGGCFKKAANFRGRASRAEYWYWILLTILTGYLPFTFSSVNGGFFRRAAYWISGALILVYLVVGLSVAVRRLHDVGRSGWTLLWKYVPLACLILYVHIGSSLGEAARFIAFFVVLGANFMGFVYLLALCSLPGSLEPNRHGLPPEKKERRSVS